MAQSKSYAEQAGILLLGKILATLSEALVPLIIARLFGKVDVGILSSLLLLYMTIAVILTSGFPETIMFYLPTRGPDERRAIAWRVLHILLGLGIITAMILVLLPFLNWVAPDLMDGFVGTDKTSVINPESLRYLLVLSLYPIADIPVRMLPNLLVVEGRSRSAAMVGVIKALGTSMAFIVPMALGYDLWIVIACVTIFGYLYALILLYFLRTIYRSTSKIASPISYRDLIRFGLPLGLTEIVAKIDENVDRYLILASFAISEFAEYQYGAWQIPIVTTIAYTVGTVYTPRFAQLFKAGNPQEAINVWRQSIQKVCLVVLPLTMIFVVAAEEAVELLFTQSYLRSADIFRIYSIMTLGRVASFGTVIVAAGKPRYILYASGLALLANITLNVILLLLLGFVGPALGTMFAFVSMVVFYCICIAKAAGLKFRNIFPLFSYLRVFLVAVVAATPAVIFKLYNHWHPGLKLGIIAGIILICFGLLGSLMGQIKKDDWRYLWNWIRFRNLA